MSKFFIERPIFASVLAIIIVIAGLVAAKILPIAQYPEIAPPTVTVTASADAAPAVLIYDALSALDASAQGDLIRAIRAALPKATLISLGQTLPPPGLHDQVVTMTSAGVAATIHIREREKA